MVRGILLVTIQQETCTLEPTAIISYALSFMTSFAPINHQSQIKDDQESLEEREARYQQIAQDIVEVTFNPDIPPLFAGPTGRIQTLTLVESVMSFESFFRRDIDLGLGPQGRGDGGKSVCMMQINVGRGFVNINSNKWTAEDLLTDRKKCIEAGIEFLRSSMRACRHLPQEARLTQYASGRCGLGMQESRDRYGRAIYWFNHHQPEFTDQDVFRSLTHFVEHSN